jgi:hypothetical protein
VGGNGDSAGETVSSYYPIFLKGAGAANLKRKGAGLGRGVGDRRHRDKHGGACGTRLL